MLCMYSSLLNISQDRDIREAWALLIGNATCNMRILLWDKLLSYLGCMIILPWTMQIKFGHDKFLMKVLYTSILFLHRKYLSHQLGHAHLAIDKCFVIQGRLNSLNHTQCSYIYFVRLAFLESYKCLRILSSHVRYIWWQKISLFL